MQSQCELHQVSQAVHQMATALCARMRQNVLRHGIFAGNYSLTWVLALHCPIGIRPLQQHCSVVLM